MCWGGAERYRRETKHQTCRDVLVLPAQNVSHHLPPSQERDERGTWGLSFGPLLPQGLQGNATGLEPVVRVSTVEMSP